MKLYLILVLCVFGFVSNANAGYVEASASGTYRKSNFEPDSYDEAYSLTGSFSYLFDEMSALELSYTDAFSKRFISSLGAGTDHTTAVHTELAALDFVLTLGDKDAFLRPYIKVGIGYILKKRLTDYIGSYPSNTSAVDQPKGFVPSGGLGFRLAVTHSLSIKIGVDGWSSDPVGQPGSSKLDIAGRAGLSWLF